MVDEGERVLAGVSSEEVIVPCEDFYEESEGEKVRHVSNLEEEEQSQPEECDDMVRKMKQEELQKWD